jgi:hypothetical protein
MYILVTLHVFHGKARLAQSAERKTLNLVVVGSSPTLGEKGGKKRNSISEFALLAQLVARGSDKAKVIGSSPVESSHPSILCPELLLDLRHFLLILHDHRKKKFFDRVPPCSTRTDSYSG